MPPDDAQDMGYNSMQQQAGLLPAAIAVPPPVVFPGQISAMLAVGGPGAAMSILPMQNPLAAVGGFGAMQGYPSPSPMPGGGFGGANPYSNMAGSPTSVFSPSPAAPPPMYAGPQMAPGIFGAGPAASMFNTPYGASVEQGIAEERQNYANRAGYAGMGARIGSGIMAGVAGAALGGRFGGVPGAVIGGLGAMFGAEHFGVNQFAQNTFMEQVMAPRIQQRGFAAGIEHQSQSFMPFGSGAMGVGLSSEDASRAAERIADLGNSASFRQQTFDKFNASDMAAITQGAGASGMLGGVRNVEQMAGRVREVAKSLSAFMELAQEPDIQRALQSMGNLRASGLNLSETLGAVQNGRAFARMAGMSFQEMAEVGGGAGSAMFQNFGMSAGTGARAGMANLGMAVAAQNAGILDPAMMSMLRGPQGLAAMSNQFSANMLNMPMLAPAMMTTTGGLNLNAIRGLAAGGGNLFEMTSRGSNNLTGMTGRLGVEGLGMAVGMQPLLRDAIGRALQTQGPYAQRNMEDSQVMALARNMNMRGSAGFITAAQAMGMSDTQAVARAQELSSPAFYEMQRRTADVQRREARADGDRIREDNVGGFTSALRQSRAGEVITGIEHRYHALGRGLSRMVGGEDSMAMSYEASTDEAMRRQNALVRSRGFEQYMRSRTTRDTGRDELSVMQRLRLSGSIAEASGGVGISGGLASLGVARTFSDQELRATARNIVQGGRLSEELMYGGTMDRREAAEHMGATFGEGVQGTAAMTRFARGIASMTELNAGVGTMAVNAFARLGSGALMPGALGTVVDIGNVAGGRARTATDYRRAYVEAMRGSGVSAEEAGRTFDRSPMLAIQQAAPTAQLMMTNQDRQNLEDSIRIGQGIRTGRGEGLRGFEEERRQASRGLLGREASTSTTNAFMGIMDDIRGVGREGSRGYERSRYYIGALAAASATVGNDPSSRRRAQDAIAQLSTQARQEGLNVAELSERATAVRGRFESGEGQTAAREFMQGAGGQKNIINTFEAEDTRLRRSQAGTNIAGSMAYLRAAGGAVAGLTGGMTAENFSSERFRNNLLSIASDPTRLRQLQGQGAFGADVAGLIRRMQAGGEEGEKAYGEIFGMMEAQGRQATRVREEQAGTVRNRVLRASANIGRAYDWIGRKFGYEPGIAASWQRRADEALDRDTSSALLAKSEGERTAARASLNSTAAESQTGRAGMGRAGDALLDASNQLKDVARLFRDTINSGNMGRLTP